MKPDSIKIIGDRALLKQLETKKDNSSLVVLPDSVSTPKQYEIVALGLGRVSEAGQLIKTQPLKVGDKVIIAPNAGIEITLGLDKYRLINSPDIHIVL